MFKIEKNNYFVRKIYIFELHYDSPLSTRILLFGLNIVGIVEVENFPLLHFSIWAHFAQQFSKIGNFGIQMAQNEGLLILFA